MRLQVLTLVALFALQICNGQTTNFTYWPELSFGDFTVGITPRRDLDVVWKGRHILAQGGELFSRSFQEANTDGDWITGGKLGLYRLSDTNAALNVPIQVVRSSSNIVLRWVTDASQSAYRQVNEMVMDSSTLRVTTSLSVSNGTASTIEWHPVFFPGLQTSHSDGVPDSSISGLTFSIANTNGVASNLVYSASVNTNQWTFGTRAFSVAIPEGTVHVTLRSDAPSWEASLFSYAKWPMAWGVGTRRGLVGHLAYSSGTGPVTRTHEIVIQTRTTNAVAGSPSAVSSEMLLLTPIRSGSPFWHFEYGTSVAGTLRIDNRSLSLPSTGQLAWVVRDYEESVNQSGSVSTNVSANSYVDLPFDFGVLGRGSYSVEWSWNVGGSTNGYTVSRVGVVPIPTANAAFGGHSPYSEHIASVIELARSFGIGEVRFRAETKDERWHVYEPSAGSYISTSATAKAIADDFAESSIPLFFSGGHFPPITRPSWLTSGETYTFANSYGTTAFLPTNIALFNAFQKSWSSNYVTNVFGFEVMNEPSYDMALTNATKIIGLTFTNIRSSHPTAKILAPTALASYLPNTTLPWISNVFIAARSNIDILTYHHYPGDWRKTNSAEAWETIEYTPWESVVQYVKSLGTTYGKPVWNSEMGWCACPEELFPATSFSHAERDTASMQMRAYLLSFANGAEKVTQCWSPEVRDPNFQTIIYPERQGSFVGWGWMPKPWAIAHARLSALMNGMTFAGRRTLENTNAYLVCWTNYSSAFAAGWSAGSSILVSWPFGESAHLESVVGQTLSSPSSSYTLSTSPKYAVKDSGTAAAFVSSFNEIAQVPPSIPRLNVGRMTTGTFRP